MGKLFGAVKHAAKDFADDECMVSGAAIAYYTIFALPPLLVIVFFIAGLFGVSQQKIDRVVKEQLGLPTSQLSQQQQSQQSAASPVSQTAPANSQVFANDRDTEADASPDAPVEAPRPAGAGGPSSAAVSTRADPAVDAPEPGESPGEGPAVVDSEPGTSTAPAAEQPLEPSDQPAGHIEATGASRNTRQASSPPQPQPVAGMASANPSGRQANGGVAAAGQPGAAQPQGAQQPQPGAQPQGQGEQPGGLGGVASRAQSQSSPLSALGPVSKVIGIIVLVFSATGVFAQLQHALNRAWEVEPDPAQGGILSFIFKRLLSLGMVAVLAFLLLVSLVLTTLVDELVNLVTGGGSGWLAVAAGFILNNLAILALGTVLFAAMFKLLPDARMRWKDTWVGAFITAVLFVIGKSLLAWYLESSSIDSTWGSAAASMIAMLVWVYYTTLIVLFGAELAQVWAVRYGAGIEPAKGAVRIVEEKHRVRESAA